MYDTSPYNHALIIHSIHLFSHFYFFHLSVTPSLFSCVPIRLFGSPAVLFVCPLLRLVCPRIYLFVSVLFLYLICLPVCLWYLFVGLSFYLCFDCLSLVMVCLSVSGFVVSLFLVLVVCFCLSVSGFVGLSVVLVCSPLFLSLILIFCMSVRVSVSGLVVCLSFWFLSSAGNKPNYKGPKIEVRQQTRSIEEGKRVNLFCRLTEEPESGKWYHLRVLRARLYNHLLVFGVDSGRGEEEGEGLGRGRWEGVEEIAVHAQNVKSGIFVRNTG